MKLCKKSKQPMGERQCIVVAIVFARIHIPFMESEKQFDFHRNACIFCSVIIYMQIKWRYHMEDLLVYVFSFRMLYFRIIFLEYFFILRITHTHTQRVAIIRIFRSSPFLSLTNKESAIVSFITKEKAYILTRSSI